MKQSSPADPKTSRDQMTDRVDYLVIGGGVAGGHAVFEIRRRDKSGRIVVVNRENQFSYDRPPLPSSSVTLRRGVSMD